MTGRSVKPKPTFMFSSGEIVTLERVGPLFALPIQRANPPPPPPLAPGVGGALEPNPADPDYEKTLADHNMKVLLIIQETLLDLGISDDLPGYDQARVDRVRRAYERSGITMPETDRMIWIKHVCITTQADMEGLFEAIRNYDVTEEAITTAAEMFPSDSFGAATSGSVTASSKVPASV